MTGASNVNKWIRNTLFALLSVLPACGQQLVEFRDSGVTDAARMDTPIADGDTANADISSPDALKDSNVADAADADAVSNDVSSTDTANNDIPTVDSVGFLLEPSVLSTDPAN